MNNSLDLVYERHADHQAEVRLRVFRNGTEHWELRCSECDAHIQWLKRHQVCGVNDMVKIEKPYVSADELWGY